MGQSGVIVSYELNNWEDTQNINMKYTYSFNVLKDMFIIENKIDDKFSKNMDKGGLV